MNPELERYLLAILALLSLIAGLLVTQLTVGVVSISPTVLILPVAIGALIGGIVLWLAESAVTRSH